MRSAVLNRQQWHFCAQIVLFLLHISFFYSNFVMPAPFRKAAKAANPLIEKTMRKNFGAKPLSYPQPVFIIATYDENGTPDAMNAAWGGISEMNEISLCLSAGHKTVKNLLKTGAFTVSMADVPHVAACDYVGLVSGNKVPDKFQRAGFHATKSAFVKAPLIDELAVALECKVKDYNPDTCILRGEIVNVSADERVLDENGKVDAAKVAPIVFDPFNNEYLRIGEKVGKAFAEGKKLK